MGCPRGVSMFFEGIFSLKIDLFEKIALFSIAGAAGSRSHRILLIRFVKLIIK